MIYGTVTWCLKFEIKEESTSRLQHSACKWHNLKLSGSPIVVYSVTEHASRDCSYKGQMLSPIWCRYVRTLRSIAKIKLQVIITCRSKRARAAGIINKRANILLFIFFFIIFCLLLLNRDYNFSAYAKGNDISFRSRPRFLWAIFNPAAPKLFTPVQKKEKKKRKKKTIFHVVLLLNRFYFDNSTGDNRQTATKCQT